MVGIHTMLIQSSIVQVQCHHWPLGAKVLLANFLIFLKHL